MIAIVTGAPAGTVSGAVGGAPGSGSAPWIRELVGELVRDRRE
jgi:hypothetical protein